MLTYTGVHVTKDHGAPSIRDISVQLMRIWRFAAASEVLWSVGLHSLLVADIGMQDSPAVPEIHFLLHDAAECIVSDVPRPMKGSQQKAIEQCVTERIYESLGLPLPFDFEIDAVHDADMKAVNAEGSSKAGPRGYAQMQSNFSRDPFACAKLAEYLATYTPEEAIKPNGRWTILFEKRIRRALRAVQNVNYHRPA